MHGVRFFVLLPLVLLTACWTADDSFSSTFESGQLDPWTLVTADPPGYNTGSGAIVESDLFSPSIPPSGGQYMAYITTLQNEGVADFGTYDDCPDIDGNGWKETEYSAIRITFVTHGTRTISVDLNFLSAEIAHGPPASVNDSDVFGIATGTVQSGPYVLLAATAVGDGSYSGTADLLEPGDFSDTNITDSPFGRYPTIIDQSQYNGETGFGTFTFTVERGVHSWTFFVADSHTDGVASGLLIDNFTVSP
jgi:hypothetical protein